MLYPLSYRGLSGSGRDRTADLLFFTQTLVPAELQSLARMIVAESMTPVIVAESMTPANPHDSSQPCQVADST